MKRYAIVSDVSDPNVSDFNDNESNKVKSLESVNVTDASKTNNSYDVVDEIYTDANDIEGDFVFSTPTIQNVETMNIDFSANEIVESSTAREKSKRVKHQDCR